MAVSKIASKETVIVNNVSCGSQTVNASGAIGTTVDVSSSIPSGYKLVGVMPRATGGYWLYWYACAVATETSITINLFRAVSSNTTATPTVALVCQKA